MQKIKIFDKKSPPLSDEECGTLQATSGSDGSDGETVYHEGQLGIMRSRQGYGIQDKRATFYIWNKKDDLMHFLSHTVDIDCLILMGWCKTG